MAKEIARWDDESEPDEPLDWDNSVRESSPTLPAMRMNDFVGSEVLLKLIRYKLERVRRRKEPLPHHVFSGIRGMGKRTLAKVIANEFGVEFQQADCRLIKAPIDVLPLLSNAGYGSVLLLSNIDALKASCGSFLAPAVSNFHIDIGLGDGTNARTVSMKLQPFTLIATIEDAKKVPAFLRTAATMLEFGPAPHTEVANLICRHIKRTPHALALAIVEECNPVPGEAVQITRRLIEYGNAVANGKLSRTIIRQGLHDLGIYSVPAVNTDESPRRHAIPANVREFVWKRDSGRCVRCGSRIRLEFDHIVPVSKGGSNTARNVELLCETCNRRKGPSVALFD